MVQGHQPQCIKHLRENNGVRSSRRRRDRFFNSLKTRFAYPLITYLLTNTQAIHPLSAANWLGLKFSSTICTNSEQHQIDTTA